MRWSDDVYPQTMYAYVAVWPCGKVIGSCIVYRIVTQSSGTVSQRSHPEYSHEQAMKTVRVRGLYLIVWPMADRTHRD